MTGWLKRQEKAQSPRARRRARVGGVLAPLASSMGHGTTPRVIGPIIAVVLLAMFGLTALSAQHQDRPPECRHDGGLAFLPEVPEASGAAASRSLPGRIWVHNDSGQPVLFALDARGAVTGRVRLTGIAIDDWEAIAVGPCPDGTCLYLGDIGDNSAKRKRIAIYRVKEPNRSDGEVAIRDVIYATYPDKPHDAEALLITPRGDLFIVTKGDTSPIDVYRFPPNLQTGSTVQLTRVGARDTGRPARDDRITDGTVSPNGRWAVLRTHTGLYVYPTQELLRGEWQHGVRVDVSDLKEPQGEGVTFGDDETLYLVGEGGGRSRPGTFARLTCRF